MEPLRARGCRAKMPSARLRVAMRMRRCFACLVVDLRGDVCLAGPKLVSRSLEQRHDRVTSADNNNARIRDSRFGRWGWACCLIVRKGVG
jgi:hypothetical protein